MSSIDTGVPSSLKRPGTFPSSDSASPAAA